YYASQTIDGCESAERLPITVRINHVNAGRISGDQTVCMGTAPLTFTSETDASGAGDISYRWESSEDESTWNSINGVTEASYLPPALNQTTFFRRVAVSVLEGVECETFTETVAVVITDDCDITSEKTVVDE